MNRLSQERSAYLRHASDQKIRWYPWSEEAFEKARAEDKPVFLSSGAVWCHWCHVMAQESFYNEEVAGILNDRFISVKLDRDERPDVDRRYQMSVALMGAGGGWPLSVFLTPEKKPFFGGTYFPPEDRFGRPGFKKVLKAVAELYQTKRGEVAEYTEKLVSSLGQERSADGTFSKSDIDTAAQKILAEYDAQHGGFGVEPKFPMPGAIEFLMFRYFVLRDDASGFAVRKTLEAMAKGGFYDQIGGGFHRYATDRAWIIPHFEKMADDNAWLLRNYLNASALFRDSNFREVAVRTISFIRETLSDSEGGFYASQDADVTPGDEGGYFTWTEDDFKRVLDDDEREVMALHLMNEAGSMHHDSSKKVLFVSMEAEEISKVTGRDYDAVQALILSGRQKLLRERATRETPFIDRTLYASVNGMMISVFLLASRVLGDAALRNFALLSLRKIMDVRYKDGQLFHTDGVKAMLDDYVHLADAFVAAYEATGTASYLQQAEDVMSQCIDALWDDEAGGFHDAESDLLGVRIKAIEDIPHPSANALAVIILLKLHASTGNDTYFTRAEKSLRFFSSRAKGMGVHAGYFFCALYSYFYNMKLAVEAQPDSQLSMEASSLYPPFTTLIYGEDRGRIVPCFLDTCAEPVESAEQLQDFFHKRKYLPGEAR